MKKPDYDWWVQHAHTDSAFLLLMDNPDVFEQAVMARLEMVGRPHDQGLVNQAAWRAIHEQDRYGSMSSILEAIQPEPEVAPSRPFQGKLRTDHRAIRDDVGPFPLIGVSGFWAPWAVQHDQGQLDRLIAWARGCGMTYVRWFGSHDWHGGIDPRTTPHYFSLMGRTVEYLAAHGLRSQITLCTRRHLIQNVQDFAKHWGALIDAYRDKICLVECVNEWNHPHNGWEDGEVRAMAETLRSYTQAPLALSAPAAPTWDEQQQGLTALYQGSVASAVTCHFPRRDNTHEGAWKWVRQPWHGRHGIEGCPTLTVDNEHQRWDESAGGRLVAVAAAAPITALIAGCGMSAHHDIYGVHVDKGEYEASASALQCTLGAVIPTLPSDLANWQATRVGDGGGPHPFPSLLEQHWSFDNSLDHGVSRAFASVRDDRFVMVLTGVRNHVTLHDVQSRPYRVLSLSTGELVADSAGPDIRLNQSDGEAFYAYTY